MEEEFELEAKAQPSEDEVIPPQELPDESVTDSGNERQEEVVAEPAETDQTAEALKKAAAEISAHFDSLKNLIRYTKEKDTNLTVLTKQLEAYRTGMEYVMFKTVAMELIDMRESCRKSVRTGEMKDYDAATASKYIKYLIMDLEDMLANLGVEEKNGKYLYNGKSLDGEGEVKKAEIPEITVYGEEKQLPELAGMEGLAEYLQACEKKIAEMIKDNAALDKLTGVYLNMALQYEKGIYQVALYPVIRRIIKMYKKFKERADEELKMINNDNGRNLYVADLQYISDMCLNILNSCGVDADICAEDAFDAKKVRILKVVTTDDPQLHGKIMFRYTNCYIMGDKVIYTAKVDVYKAQ